MEVRVPISAASAGRSAEGRAQTYEKGNKDERTAGRGRKGTEANRSGSGQDVLLVHLRQVHKSAILQWRAQGHLLHADGLDGRRNQDGVFLPMQAHGQSAALRWLAQKLVICRRSERQPVVAWGWFEVKSLRSAASFWNVRSGATLLVVTVCPRRRDGCLFAAEVVPPDPVVMTTQLCKINYSSGGPDPFAAGKLDASGS